MGYGHNRAAYALGDYVSLPVMDIDDAPLAQADEQKRWARIRAGYERLSRASAAAGPLGGPMRALLENITGIPSLYPRRDLSRPNLSARLLEREIRRGLGQDFKSYLQDQAGPMVSTFYAPAIMADRLGIKNVYCVVTDSDINRVWAPYDPASSHLIYCVPSQRARRRLRAYGVSAEQIRVTGFPLPHELLGGPQLTSLKHNLAKRLHRLDPFGSFRKEIHYESLQLLGAEFEHAQDTQPPRLSYAVGGAGAQTQIVEHFLPSCAELLRENRLRITLVAGIRNEVAENLKNILNKLEMQDLLGTSIDILVEDDIAAYFKSFNTLMADTDILWTKPSELSFFAALGLPVICAWPVGVHERYNRRWLIENGAGFKQRDPKHAGEWLKDWIKDGTLAAAAWSAFVRLPKHGLYEIADAVFASNKT
ncbi:MAG: hypothetical protein IPJ88_18855 [Myxococcales bacterium]|nr:MAG: hypothetical protein IPJ88_18855 [Myxococcales bacterium]